jgi:hypothetical protein
VHCDSCKQEKPTAAAILGGSFGEYCIDCLSKDRRMPQTGAAQYSRDQDRADHQRDVIQPWDARGNPSSEFIRQYPEQAVEYFTDEQLRKYS